MPDARIPLITDDGTEVSAVCPVIISASRSTDIPAYYAEWFIKRLDKGYVRWINSFNPRLPYYVSFERTRAVIFWSKNPAPILPYLHLLDTRGLSYYFLYTLNDYEKEGFEPDLPPLQDRIRTFIRLSEYLGRERVIWRFDPVLVSESLDLSGVLGRIRTIGDQIAPYTERLVFSFVEMKYGKVKRQATVHGFRGLSSEEKEEYIRSLIRMNESWGLSLASCADEAEYASPVIHNRCIDGELLARIGRNDPQLIRYIETTGKDPGQRPACRCIRSKDIGQYDTCLHGCVYCYATDHEKARGYYQKHRASPESDTISGEKPACVQQVNRNIRNFV